MQKKITWFLVFSFILGFSYGLFDHNETIKNIKLSSETQIEVLLPSDFLPEDLLENFKAENGAQINIHTYQDMHELEEKLSLDSGVYDLVLMPHSNVPEFKSKGLLFKLDHNLIRNLANLSIDFFDLPTDPGSEYSIPLIWGVKQNSNVTQTGSLNTMTLNAQAFSKEIWLQSNNSLKIAKGIDSKKIQRQMQSLWIQSFVVPSTSENKKLAHEMINFFLAEEVAVELTRLTQKPSVNQTVESAPIASELKPSHLRKQKLALLTKVQAQ